MSVRQINNLLKPFIMGLACLVLAACTGSGPTRSEESSLQASNDPRLTAEFNRAVSILQSGNEQLAFKLFSDITKKYPDSSGAHVNIGLAYLKSNKLKEAETAFNNAIGINSKNAVAYNGLGVVLRKQGKFKEAETAYLTALSINAKYANAHLNIGILQDIYFDSPDKALTHYQEYMKHAANKDKMVEKWIIDVQRRSAVPAPKGSTGGSKG